MLEGQVVELKTGQQVKFVETVVSPKGIDVHYFSHPEWGDNLLSLTDQELTYNRKV